MVRLMGRKPSNYSDPAVQAGITKIHRGTDGSIIGGVTAEGNNIGYRPSQSISPRAWRRPQDAAAARAQYSATATAQTPVVQAPVVQTPQTTVQQAQVQSPQGQTSPTQKAWAQSKLPSPTPRLDAGVQTPGIDAMKQSIGYRAGESYQDLAVRKQNESAVSGAFGTGPQQDAQAERIKKRQALFADMQKAGPEGLNADMRLKAKDLGVDDAGWQRGVAKLKVKPQAEVAMKEKEPVYRNSGMA